MMTEENTETYNGWKNYPTWAVNMWLSNDQGTYNETRERVREVLEQDHPTSEYWSLAESKRFNTADMLKDFVEDLAHEEYDKASMLSDLIGYALGEVDWEEIASHWVRDEEESGA